MLLAVGSVKKVVQSFKQDYPVVQVTYCTMQPKFSHALFLSHTILGSPVEEDIGEHRRPG